jgi:hypothetical protein
MQAILSLESLFFFFFFLSRGDYLKHQSLELNPVQAKAR